MLPFIAIATNQSLLVRNRQNKKPKNNKDATGVKFRIDLHGEIREVRIKLCFYEYAEIR
jgi:hypothetical protein